MTKSRVLISVLLVVAVISSVAFAAGTGFVNNNHSSAKTKVVSDTASFLKVAKAGTTNVIITGPTDKKVVVDLAGESLKIDNLNNVQIRNISFVNVKYIRSNFSKNVTFSNNTFTNFINNGLYFNDGENIVVENSTFNKMGSVTVEPSWQGSAIYAARVENLIVRNNEISNTYGHGGVFVSDSNNVLVDSNTIHDTFYRAIQLYDGLITGTISNNLIYNAGSINTSYSGVGANGIFASGADVYGVTVYKNTIQNVLENGIEGKFGRVDSNIVDGTGIDTVGHPTPSTEGIYANGRIYVNNIVKNSKGDGIKVYSQSPISNLVISGNHISRTSKDKAGITLISSVSYSNVLVSDNTVDNFNEILYVYKSGTADIAVSNNIGVNMN